MHPSTPRTLALLALAAGALLARPRDARACGGCFVPTTSPSETQTAVSSHRMVMAVHPGYSVLWDQIRYAGRPEDFSWVLPVSGDVQVDLGSDEFFERLERATQVTVQGPTVPLGCPSGPSPGFSAADYAAAADAGSSPTDPVQVLMESVVGPYQTVTLRSTDAMALTDWLRANNYFIPPAIMPVIQYYTDRRMDFLALRLRPGEGVTAMQPVRVRYAASNMVLPLRMVAAGVGDKVGITLWVFGTGRYEAANFGNATISESDLVWDWDANRSNYADVWDATLRGLGGGRGFITEYAGEAGQVSYCGGGCNGRYGCNGYPQPGYNCYGMTASADAGADGGAGGVTFADDLDLATNQRAPGVWVSRLRTDLAAGFLDADLELQAAASNTAVSNLLHTTRETGTSPEPRCGASASYSAGGAAAVGCAVGSPGRASGGAALLGAGLAGAALLGARRRRRAQQRSADERT
jgi:hypothetical protein